MTVSILITVAETDDTFSGQCVDSYGCCWQVCLCEHREVTQKNIAERLVLLSSSCNGSTSTATALHYALTDFYILFPLSVSWSSRCASHTSVQAFIFNTKLSSLSTALCAITTFTAQLAPAPDTSSTQLYWRLIRVIEALQIDFIRFSYNLRL